MDVFLQIVFSYPTAVFSMLLAVLVVYWLIAMLGLVELDAIDGWLAPDIDVADAVDTGGFAGVLAKFGLGGLPLMLVLTVLVMVAWVLSYFVDYLLLRHLPGSLLRLLLGSGVVLGAIVVGAPVTGVLLRPLRRMFAKLRPAPPRSLLGLVGVVRSPAVDTSHGIAGVEDGGAGLVLQVRSDGGGASGTYRRGDRVVLIEYLEADNAYRVIGESEFKGL